MHKFFYELFWNVMKYTKGFISKWRKGELRIYRYQDVKVATLNDFENRRVLVWYFYQPTRKIIRIAYHGYFYRHLANKIAHTVKLIQDDDNYREFEIYKRRSYSYKAQERRRAIKAG